MSLGAYVSGWFVKADPDFGRLVTNDVQEALASLAYTAVTTVWADSSPTNGEPTKGAAVIVVDAPDATHKELEKLPNNQVFPINPTANSLAAIQQFLSDKGVTVDLGTSQTRKEAAGRAARAISDAFIDFDGFAAGL